MDSRQVTPDVVVAVLGFSGVFITQWTMFVISVRKGRDQTRRIEEINDAVNHRHERGGAKMYDLTAEVYCDVKELIEWKRGYDGGPLDNGAKVHAFVSATNDRLERIESNVTKLNKQCDET